MSMDRKEALSNSRRDEYYPQLWFLLISVLIFAAYVAWDLGLFSLITSLDRSYMASLTMALVVIMSLHCGWHTFQLARRTREIMHWMQHKQSPEDNPYAQQLVSELTASVREKGDTADAILEIYADEVRAPTELGWFFVDLAVRFGLLGTIIGFILIFASLDNIDIQGGDDLKNLLIAMSGGMGTALYTTLTGLVGATLLSFQYLILGRQGEHLVGLLLRTREHVQNMSPVQTT